MFALSEQHFASFAVDGFLVIQQLFDDEEMAAILSIARSDQRLIREAHVRRDASGGESKLVVRNELAESPYAAIVRSQRVAGSMMALLGDEVYHYHHKMMLKEPRVGGAWEWHQDYGYWYHNGCLYPDMGSCLIAVDRATRRNGCLQVLRGSQRMGASSIPNWETKPSPIHSASRPLSSGWNWCTANSSRGTPSFSTAIYCIGRTPTAVNCVGGH